MTYLAVALTWLLICRLNTEARRRTLNVLIGLDQLAWVVLTLGNGSPDETISAALYRMERQGKWAGRTFRPLVDLIFLPFERDHCRNAYNSEFRKLQLPPEYRGD
jgi:hypothetical protein